MPQLSTCLQGHQWQTASKDLAAGNGVCPICGGPALPSEAVTVVVPARAPEPATLPPFSTVIPADIGVAIPGYEIFDELGRGGMGVVYKARQVKADRLVALKMILVGGHAGEQALARFRAEAQAVAQLQHPNIVQVFEVGDDHGLPFFSLELCPGGSLEKKLAGTPLPSMEAARLVETLARAMQAAHDKGIVHRDLKPANVLLADDRTPKITDFGLAKRLDSAGQTGTGAVLGTPSYMAPEQAGGQGKSVGPAADIYALGAILYECLTGRPPFRAATPLDTVLQVVSEEPVPPRRLQPKVPPDVETICLKCLHKDPAKRYASALELAEDLRRFRSGETIWARRSSAWERTWRWCRRNPLVASLIAMVVLSLAAAFVVLAVSNVQIKAEQQQTKDALEAEKQATDDVLRARENEQQTLYYRLIGLDERESATKNVGRAEEVLDECPLRLRGWEWHYLKRRLYQDPLTFRGHEAWVTGVAFSPDGRLVASTSSSHSFLVGEIKVWDRTTGEVVHKLRGHIGPVSGVAFSPDGRRIASAGWDRSSKVYDFAAPDKPHTLYSHSEYVSCVAFSGDGKLIASGSGDHTVRIWDATSFKELRKLNAHDRGLYAAAFSPDGKLLASASGDRTVRVWDPATGKQLHVLSGHAGPVLSVAFSRDGRRIASGSFDGTVKLWDAESGREDLTIRPATVLVTSVAFSPDGQRLAVGSWEKTIKIWDLVSNKEALTLREHQDMITAVAFSPDGLQLASSSVDGTVRIWDASPPSAKRSPEAVTLRGHEDIVLGVAFRPESNQLATTSFDQTVKFWNATTGEEIRTLRGHPGPVAGLVFSRDGRRLASGDFAGVAKVWDAASGEEIHSFDNFGGSVGLSADGQRVAFSLEGGTIHVLDAATGKEKLPPFRGHDAPIISIAFSPEGKRLATASWDNMTKVWDAETGRQLHVLRGHRHFVQYVVFSADGKRLATASWDKTARVWDAETSKELFALEHDDRVLSVAFSPDGKRLATAGWGGVVKIWDGATGKEIDTLGGHTGFVTSVAFSPDGKRLASASGYRGKGEVKIWDLAPADNRAK